jgi:hypothetical protein
VCVACVDFHRNPRDCQTLFSYSGFSPNIFNVDYNAKFRRPSLQMPYDEKHAWQGDGLVRRFVPAVESRPAFRRWHADAAQYPRRRR